AFSATVWVDDAIVKYRQSQMSALGGHMSSIAAVVKKEVPYTDHLAAHAQGLAATAAFTKAVFKEKALNDKSTSKPEIWSDWDRLAKRADALEAAAAQLAKAVEANDQGAVRKYVGEVGKSCKGCHDDFKMKRGG